MLNFAAITGAIESPCKKCPDVDEDKEVCSLTCKKLKEVQKFLDGYSKIFAGKIIDVEDAYPIRYCGFEDSVTIDKANSDTATLIPVGINMIVKNKVSTAL